MTMTSKTSEWNGQVEQELTFAVRARDVTARRAHLEQAILFLESDLDDHSAQGRARELLTSALFARTAFDSA